MVNYSFHWRPVFEALPDMLWGCLVTIEIAVLSTAIGIVFGVALALARTSGGKVASGFALSWIEFGRNTPGLFQIYLAYFGLGSFGLHLNSYAALTAGIAFNNAGYLAETFRGVYYPITNQMIFSVLMTALGLTVGLDTDLAGVTQRFNVLTYRTFEYFTVAAVLY